MLDKQKTKILMTVSTLFLGVLGLGMSFFPQEILTYFDIGIVDESVVLVSLLGGMYVGFALLNWMARSNIIGAIYSRPVAVGNFAHFLIAAITLLKHLFSTTHLTVVFILVFVNTVLALCFGYILFAGGKSCN